MSTGSMEIIVVLCELRRLIRLRRWPLAYLAAWKLDCLLADLQRPA